MTTPVNHNAVPTNPYHIARAYGVQPAIKARPVQPVQPVQRAEPAQATQKIDEGLSGVRRLVGAVVPGRVDFSVGEAGTSAARPSDSAAIPMYRHPADRNTAATGVMMGKAIDVSG